ncbi:MAG: hypothetical protein QXP80_03225 [Zestosphaera sp.]
MKTRCVEAQADVLTLRPRETDSQLLRDYVWTIKGYGVAVEWKHAR